MALPVISRKTLVEKWDNNPLVAASYIGDIDWIREQLSLGADVNAFSEKHNYSPLIIASQKNHVNIVRDLLMTGKCDLTKKHMDYISALDSALFGYTNLEGIESAFSPEIQAMIIRAHIDTADRITPETLLHIEISGTVSQERLKAFKNAGGYRLSSKYPKPLPRYINLADPPESALRSIELARDAAIRKLNAPVIEITKKKKKKIEDKSIHISGGAGSDTVKTYDTVSGHRDHYRDEERDEHDDETRREASYFSEYKDYSSLIKARGKSRY